MSDPLSELEDERQRKATATVVADARKIAQSDHLKLAAIPIGKLPDQAWGWIISAAIFG